MVTIYLMPSWLTIAGSPQATVWEALQAAGYAMRMGCRRGGCGICQVRLRAGRVQMGAYAETALPEEQRSQGWVLACRAYPVEDVEIEIRDDQHLRPVAPWWARVAGNRPSNR
ncbi:MAG: 2Fe-2S iron-sulfur cluster binding domain-containing protein [Firmicutes bacterium]|nr:2Fe-2S iron-sulfur cluster binding domain-containing protein [Bacillota bacterium]